MSKAKKNIIMHSKEKGAFTIITATDKKGKEIEGGTWIFETLTNQAMTDKLKYAMSGTMSKQVTSMDKDREQVGTILVKNFYLKTHCQFELRNIQKKGTA